MITFKIGIEQDGGADNVAFTLANLGALALGETEPTRALAVEEPTIAQLAERLDPESSWVGLGRELNAAIALRDALEVFASTGGEILAGSLAWYDEIVARRV